MCCAVFLRAFHGVEPYRGAVFQFPKSHGAAWCDFYFLRIKLCGAVRCRFHFFKIIRSGAVCALSPYRCGTVRCGAVRCGADFSRTVRCGAVMR